MAKLNSKNTEKYAFTKKKKFGRIDSVLYMTEYSGKMIIFKSGLSSTS